MKVSIPFKRESVSKGYGNSAGCEPVLLFQFPSNGKVYPKTNPMRVIAPDPGFQFPSNGKVYPKFNSPSK